MIRRFTSAQFVPADAGANDKNPMGSTLLSTLIIAPTKLDRHEILRNFCQESARKGLMLRRAGGAVGLERPGFESTFFQERGNCERSFGAHRLSTCGAPACQLSGLRGRVLREDLLHSLERPFCRGLRRRFVL